MNKDFDKLDNIYLIKRRLDSLTPHIGSIGKIELDVGDFRFNITNMDYNELRNGYLSYECVSKSKSVNLTVQEKNITDNQYYEINIRTDYRFASCPEAAGTNNKTPLQLYEIIKYIDKRNNYKTFW